MVIAIILARQACAQISGFPENHYSDFGQPEIQAEEGFISQTGNANFATIDQQIDPGGTGNYAQTDQIGNANYVTINQAGSANRARIEQNGSLNTATLAQYGSGNSLDLTQTGTGNRFNMTQIGESRIVASQLGDYNLIDAPLIGVGGSGTMTETGNNNSITVSPNYNGPNLQNVTASDGMHVTVN
jgi:hypothetical protein